MINPIDEEIRHVTAEGAYDNNTTYKTITKKFTIADIVIPPQKGAAENKDNEFFRNRYILEIKYYGTWNGKNVENMASEIILS